MPLLGRLLPIAGRFDASVMGDLHCLLDRAQGRNGPLSDFSGLGESGLEEIRFVLFGEPAYRVFEMVNDAARVAEQMERLAKRRAEEGGAC